MPEYTVSWECLCHGSSTITARDKEAARDKFDLEQEGVELSNIRELYASDAHATGVEYFQESADDDEDDA